jgi:hypothetical protein
MDISIGTLAHPCGTSVPLPPQLPERFACFILLAKVSNESTGVHPQSLWKWDSSFVKSREVFQDSQAVRPCFVVRERFDKTLLK